MYQSLVQTGEKFRLYIFAFDDLTKEILNDLNLPFVQVISLTEFETDELLQIKETRTRGEYCWTCTPFSILHVLEHYHVEEITYLDADLFFYHAPQILLDEFHSSDKDVMITEHRYTSEYDQSRTSGIYCVQFMTFKSAENGRKILLWWKERCAEWCYSRLENGKFGDQKYLDDWPERFDGVYVMQNIGGGVAPWNVQQYCCEQGPMIHGQPVIFYHFHALKWLENNQFDLSTYRLDENSIRYIYRPYIEALKESLALIRQNYDLNFSKGFYQEPESFLFFLRKLKRKTVGRFKGCYNVIEG